MSEPDLGGNLKDQFRIEAFIRVFDDEYNKDNILSRFVIEEYVVRKYEDAMDWRRKVGNKPVALFVSAYVLGILATASLEIFTSVSESTRGDVLGVVFGLPVLVGSVLWIAKGIFSKVAERAAVDPEDAVYHRFARAIQEFENSNYEISMQEVLSAGKMMDYENTDPFSPQMSNSISDYIDKVDGKNSIEFYKDTFPNLANRILYELSIIYDFEDNPLYEEEVTIEQADKYGPLDMVFSYLNHWTDNRFVRILFPYVIATPILFLVYQENEQAAQILAIIVVAVVQTYYRPSSED